MCEVPPNTEALIYLPATDVKGITESGKSLALQGEIRVVKMAEGKAVLAVGSGKYDFTSLLTISEAVPR